MNLSRRELDNTVVNIELTLASIIQGVALYFLTENGRTALSLNIRVLVPLLFFFNLGCTAVINHWPDFFVDRLGNVWLIAAQLLSFLIYLFYVIRFYNRLAPLILRSHEGARQS